MSAEEFLTTIKYFSVSKFVEFIKKEKPAETIRNVKLYYKGTYTFIDKFGNMCLKPIYIIIFTNSKPVYINHEKLLYLFDAQPVIQFKTNKARRLPEGRYRLNMFYLTIDFKQQESKDGYKYYPIEIHKEVNQQIVDKIESLRIATYGESLEDMCDKVLLEELE